MPEMLTKAAEYYERVVESQSESLSSALEPLLLVLLAGMVGGIVVAMYLPVFSMFTENNNI